MDDAHRTPPLSAAVTGKSVSSEAAVVTLQGEATTVKFPLPVKIFTKHKRPGRHCDSKQLDASSAPKSCPWKPKAALFKCRTEAVTIEAISNCKGASPTEPRPSANINAILAKSLKQQKEGKRRRELQQKELAELQQQKKMDRKQQNSAIRRGNLKFRKEPDRTRPQSNGHIAREPTHSNSLEHPTGKPRDKQNHKEQPLPQEYQRPCSWNEPHKHRTARKHDKLPKRQNYNMLDGWDAHSYTDTFIQEYATRSKAQWTQHAAAELATSG